MSDEESKRPTLEQRKALENEFSAKGLPFIVIDCKRGCGRAVITTIEPDLTLGIETQKQRGICTFCLSKSEINSFVRELDDA